MAAAMGTRSRGTHNTYLNQRSCDEKTGYTAPPIWLSGSEEANLAVCKTWQGPSTDNDGGTNVSLGPFDLSPSYTHNPLHCSSNALSPDVHYAHHQIFLPKSTTKRHHVPKACLAGWLNGSSNFSTLLLILGPRCLGSRTSSPSGWRALSWGNEVFCWGLVVDGKAQPC